MNRRLLAVLGAGAVAAAAAAVIVASMAGATSGSVVSGGATVQRAPVGSFTVRGSHPVVSNGSQDTHASTPNSTCSVGALALYDDLGAKVATGFGLVGAPNAKSLLNHFLGGSGKEVDYPVGTTVSADAKANAAFSKLNATIQAQLLAMLRAGHSTAVLPSAVVQPPNFETASNKDLQLGFGGTQGLSITGSGSRRDGRYVGTIKYVIWDSYGFSPKDTFDGIGTDMRYLQTVCGAPQVPDGAHWFLDSISVSVAFNQPTK